MTSQVQSIEYIDKDMFHSFNIWLKIQKFNKQIYFI